MPNLEPSTYSKRDSLSLILQHCRQRSCSFRKKNSNVQKFVSWQSYAPSWPTLRWPSTCSKLNIWTGRSVRGTWTRGWKICSFSCQNPETDSNKRTIKKKPVACRSSTQDIFLWGRRTKTIRSFSMFMPAARVRSGLRGSPQISLDPEKRNSDLRTSRVTWNLEYIPLNMSMLSWLQCISGWTLLLKQKWPLPHLCNLVLSLIGVTSTPDNSYRSSDQYWAFGSNASESNKKAQGKNWVWSTLSVWKTFLNAC